MSSSDEELSTPPEISSDEEEIPLPDDSDFSESEEEVVNPKGSLLEERRRIIREQTEAMQKMLETQKATNEKIALMKQKQEKHALAAKEMESIHAARVKLRNDEEELLGALESTELLARKVLRCEAESKQEEENMLRKQHQAALKEQKRLQQQILAEERRDIDEEELFFEQENLLLQRIESIMNETASPPPAPVDQASQLRRDVKGQQWKINIQVPLLHATFVLSVPSFSTIDELLQQLKIADENCALLAETHELYLPLCTLESGEEFGGFFLTPATLVSDLLLGPGLTLEFKPPATVAQGGAPRKVLLLFLCVPCHDTPLLFRVADPALTANNLIRRVVSSLGLKVSPHSFALFTFPENGQKARRLTGPGKLLGQGLAQHTHLLLRLYTAEKQGEDTHLFSSVLDEFMRFSDEEISLFTNLPPRRELALSPPQQGDNSAAEKPSEAPPPKHTAEATSSAPAPTPSSPPTETTSPPPATAPSPTSSPSPSSTPTTKPRASSSVAHHNDKAKTHTTRTSVIAPPSTSSPTPAEPVVPAEDKPTRSRHSAPTAPLFPEDIEVDPNWNTYGHQLPEVGEHEKRIILRCFSGPLSGGVFTVGPQGVKIGRSRSYHNNIIIPGKETSATGDDAVSRAHALIYFEVPGTFFLKNISDRSRTSITQASSGKQYRIKDKDIKLRHHDIITIGQRSSFQVEIAQ